MILLISIQVTVWFYSSIYIPLLGLVCPLLRVPGLGPGVLRTPASDSANPLNCSHSEVLYLQYATLNTTILCFLTQGLSATRPACNDPYVFSTRDVSVAHTASFHLVPRHQYRAREQLSSRSWYIESFDITCST